jgi:Tfp pilus assembly protein PilF
MPGALAQQTTIPPAVSVPTSTPVQSLDRKVGELENEMQLLDSKQAQTIAYLSSSNEQYRFLLTAFGAAIGALVVIQSLFQGIVTTVQLRREGVRDVRQAQREGERDQEQHAGVKQISEILAVVKDTFDTRLDAEKQAREEASKNREQLDKVLREVDSLDRFFKKFQENIKTARRTLEDSAARLAQVPRHGFRQIANDLGDYARRFDSFKTEYIPLEEEEAHDFSGRVLYIRGIAGHYMNQPDIAKEHLTKVTEFQQPQPGDTEKASKRRIANAYYYIGIMELNFGNPQSAIDSFENANSLDPEGADFLTKVATAEAYAMKEGNESDKVNEIISEIEEGLRRKEKAEGRLEGIYSRLGSRAALVRVNMAIIGHEEGWWKEAQDLLNKTCAEDPDYYYAAATQAQIYSIRGKGEDAQRLFCAAYEAIERSGDLLIVTEVRSQILLRMVAGLCCLHGLTNKKRSDEHLDRAESLRGSLPQIGSRVCTVFSTLSKRNENSEAVRNHIALIRRGKALLQGENI